MKTRRTPSAGAEAPGGAGERQRRAGGRPARQYDLNRAAELQYGRIPELRKQLEAEEAIANEGKACSLRDKVGGDRPHHRALDEASPGQADGGGQEKLLHLEDILHQRVWAGRSCAPGERGYSPLPGGHRRSRPSHRLLLFLGPTGVESSWKPWPRPC